MERRIALYGGSFNPPGIHHELIVKLLLEIFYEVIVIPRGAQGDKPSTFLVDNMHRMNMANLAFGKISRVKLVLDDLKDNLFTPAYTLDQKYNKNGSLWHVGGYDLFRDGQLGESEIQTSWIRGSEIWEKFNFAIIPRGEFDIADFPPHNQFLNFSINGQSSTIIRSLIKKQDLQFKDFVNPKIAECITQNNLYGWKGE